MAESNVDVFWFAGCVALAIDRVSALAGVRPGGRWAQSATVAAGSLRVAVVYDYRDERVYLEVGGIVDLEGAVSGLREKGLDVGTAEAIFLDDGGRVLASQVHPHGRWGKDLMVEVGHFLWCVDQIAVTGRVAREARLPATAEPGRHRTWDLARAAGHDYRPWRVDPLAKVLRTSTPHGLLRVYAGLPGGARWLAQVESDQSPPSDPTTGVRWLPSIGRRLSVQSALVWCDATTTAHGAPVPSLRQLLTTLRADPRTP